MPSPTAAQRPTRSQPLFTSHQPTLRSLKNPYSAGIGQAEYFEITVEDGQIILTPVKLQRADAVREKLAELNITEQDVEDAVAWARQAPAPYPDKEAE